ncbi:MAG TPA: hypothetical protein PKW95_14870 [bacterium]|nr:hypothetical protein [bacterium]
MEKKQQSYQIGELIVIGITFVLFVNNPTPLVRGCLIWASRHYQGYRPSLLTFRPSGACRLRVSQFGSQPKV